MHAFILRASFTCNIASFHFSWPFYSIITMISFLNSLTKFSISLWTNALPANLLPLVLPAGGNPWYLLAREPFAKDWAPVTATIVNLRKIHNRKKEKTRHFVLSKKAAAKPPRSNRELQSQQTNPRGTGSLFLLGKGEREPSRTRSAGGGFSWQLPCHICSILLRQWVFSSEQNSSVPQGKKM